MTPKTLPRTLEEWARWSAEQVQDTVGPNVADGVLVLLLKRTPENLVQFGIVVHAPTFAPVEVANAVISGLALSMPPGRLPFGPEVTGPAGGRLPA